MFNKCILIGRLTADPELRSTPSGVNVASFRIAVNRPYTSGGERKADFINITAWRSNAEFVCKYFAKGRAIGIDGSIQTRDYTDKDGNKRNTFDVVAERVFFVEPKANGGSNEPMAPIEDVPGVNYSNGSVADFQIITNDDDLPF